jgi:hypothetical protein
MHNDFPDQPERDGLYPEHDEQDTQKQQGPIRHPLSTDLLDKNNQQD